MLPLLLSILLPAGASARPACASREAALAGKAAGFTVAVAQRVDGQDFSGTAFLLRGAAGPEWLSAGHVADSNTGDACGKADAWPNARSLKLNPVRLPQRGRRVGSLSFQVAPGDFDWQHDAVKIAREEDAERPALEAVSADYAPRPGAALIITGHYGGKYRHHPCAFKGYAAVQGQGSFGYLLECDVREDIAGMSGGAVLDACSGLVAGLVQGQFYEASDPPKGDPRLVLVVPVSRQADGELRFGVQRVIADATCFEHDFCARVDAAGRSCLVIPGGLQGLAP